MIDPSTGVGESVISDSSLNAVQAPNGDASSTLGELAEYLMRGIVDYEKLIDHQRNRGMSQDEACGGLKAYKEILGLITE